MATGIARAAPSPVSVTSMRVWSSTPRIRERRSGLRVTIGAAPSGVVVTPRAGEASVPTGGTLTGGATGSAAGAGGGAAGRAGTAIAGQAACTVVAAPIALAAAARVRAQVITTLAPRLVTGRNRRARP